MSEFPEARRMTRRLAGAVCLMSGLAWGATAWSQPPAPAQAAPPGQTAAEKYMNIKVLNDLPAGQLHDVMVYMTAALGTSCEGCHVRGTDGQLAFDKDDRRTKVTARQMLEMVKSINTMNFKGQPRVTCTTCHQGRLGPNSIPQLAQPVTPGQAAPPPREEQGTRPKPPSETVDQVVSKFIDAVGGREALGTITSRTRTGTLTNRAGLTSPLVIDEKAPGRYRESVASTPAVNQGLNPGGAWLQSGERLRELDGVEAVILATAADLTLPLDLSQRYTGLAARAYDTIDGHAVIVLTGRSSPDVNELLYFDRVSGLLLRRVVRITTPMGRLPQQFDYADYRAVGAVKMPFEVRVADWSSLSIMKFTRMTLNPSLDDGRFAKPEVKPGQ